MATVKTSERLAFPKAFSCTHSEQLLLAERSILAGNHALAHVRKATSVAARCSR